MINKRQYLIELQSIILFLQKSYDLILKKNIYLIFKFSFIPEKKNEDFQLHFPLSRDGCSINDS